MRPSSSWLLAFALAVFIGGSAGVSTDEVWLGVIAGLVPLWLTAIAFALSTDRTAVMNHTDRRAAELQDALNVLRADVRDE